MDRRTRWVGAFIIGLSLCTLFLPMLIVDPPLGDRSQWTPVQIALAVADKALPAHGGHIDWSGGLADILVLYVLTVLCAAALFLPSPRVLQVLSFIGFVLSYEAKWWDSAFHWLFGYYGHMDQWHMSRGAAWWILPWIFPALALLSFSRISLQRKQRIAE